MPKLYQYICINVNRKSSFTILLKTNSLVNRTKLIQPHLNTMDEHSIKRNPIY